MWGRLPIPEGDESVLGCYGLGGEGGGRNFDEGCPDPVRRCCGHIDYRGDDLLGGVGP